MHNQIIKQILPHSDTWKMHLHNLIIIIKNTQLASFIQTESTSSCANWKTIGLFC